MEAVQRPWLACRTGCDGCCRLRRTAWAVEVEHLRRHVATLPPVDQARLAARRADPAVQAGTRCVFLDEAGACAVYAARPIICRTHGPAVRTPAGLSWCHLNFTGLTATEVASQVPAAGVLDLERLNALLAVVNARHLARVGGPERLPLDAALDPIAPLESTSPPARPEGENTP